MLNHRPFAGIAARLALMVPLAVVVLPQSSFAEPVHYTLDPEHLTIAFMIEHIGYAKILGVFHEANGNFVFDDATGEVSEMNVTIATASVDTFDERRDKHVRSKDFLNVEKFPEMTIGGLTFISQEDGSARVTVDLTLLGETHPIELDVGEGRESSQRQSIANDPARLAKDKASAQTAISLGRSGVRQIVKIKP